MLFFFYLVEGDFVFMEVLAVRKPYIGTKLTRYFAEALWAIAKSYGYKVVCCVFLQKEKLARQGVRRGGKEEGREEGREEGK